MNSFNWDSLAIDECFARGISEMKSLPVGKWMKVSAYAKRLADGTTLVSTATLVEVQPIGQPSPPPVLPE